MFLYMYLTWGRSRNVFLAHSTRKNISIFKILVRGRNSYLPLTLHHVFLFKIVCTGRHVTLLLSANVTPTSETYLFTMADAINAFFNAKMKTLSCVQSMDTQICPSCQFSKPPSGQLCLSIPDTRGRFIRY